jgi:hypothetical protein
MTTEFLLVSLQVVVGLPILYVWLVWFRLASPHRGGVIRYSAPYTKRNAPCSSSRMY